MVEVVVDYRNLQFLITKHGKWTMDNPLPVEVQRAVILQVVHDYAEMISRVNETGGLKVALFWNISYD